MVQHGLIPRISGEAMTSARRMTVSDGEAVYHCITRCVRRAFLCGADAATGRNFDHRKGWVLSRLKQLSEIFAVDVLGYALMSTHAHIMLRYRPDILNSWTNHEIVRRWLKLYPKRYVSDEDEVQLVEILAQDKEYVSKIKIRLGSISWFMKSVNEFIARRANREDNCTGRFWEGRFKCQRLCDEASVLSCAVYIDLNPIRAKIASTPEESLYTGAYERIREYRERKEKESRLWLSPIKDTDSRRGFLKLSLAEYLNILDATGRLIRNGKRGKISDRLEPILVRLGVNPEHWLLTAQHFRRWFATVAGSSSNIKKVAAMQGKVWCKGERVSKLAFL